MNPFTKRPSESVSSFGESGLIEAIKTWLGNTSPPSPFGIGDDCAVFPASIQRQVVTVDPVVYGRHFDDQVKPTDVGAKLLKRNLSDIAAMGAKPSVAVVALILDPHVKREWLRQFYRGMAVAAREFKVKIVGGDIAQSPGTLVASLTLLGEATGPRVLTRSGAKNGDAIYVTGRLGGSLLGHHYRFIPRLAEGAWLAARAEVKSMMDLSDGLAKDIHALTPKGSRPDVSTRLLPVSAAAKRMALSSGRSAVQHALCDGEDYELLFSVSANGDFTRFERSWHKRFNTSLSRIGQFTTARSKSPDAVRWEDFQGYEHLR